MNVRRFGMVACALALVAALFSAGANAQQPAPMPKPQLPSLHEMLQGFQFPLAVPVPEKPDPVRLYKEAIDTIAKQHVALAGYVEEPVTLSGMFGGFFGGSRPARKTKMQEWLDKWGNPPRELKTLDDADQAIKEALASLDSRFDSYLVPKEVKLEDKRLDNTNVGIGIIIKLEAMDELLKGLPEDATEEQVDKALVISDKHFISVNPVRGGPAAKAGLAEGDIIREVGGKVLNGMTYTEALKLIKGKKGTKVDITVERKENGTPVTKKFTVTRDEYEVPVVTLKHLGDDVWHLKLDTFAARNAAKDVKAALDTVMQKGGKMLIFDLRDNGGGLVDQAIEIAQYMLPEGTIVSQQGRMYGSAETYETQHHVNKHVMMETRPQPSGNLPITHQRVLAVPAELPIVVLVNEWSASASELVSGCLKFNRRVKIVGVRTFGKGVGQALLDLPYGRRLHVTTFYFLPAGRFTDWVGILPDVEVKAEKGDKDNQLETAVRVVKEMYAQGIKDREDQKALEERIRQENREAWKKIQEERKQAAEARAKKEKEKEEKKKEGTTPGGDNKPAPPAGQDPGTVKPDGAGGQPGDGKPQGGGTETPGTSKPADGATPSGTTPATNPTGGNGAQPAPGANPGQPTTPANPLIDPNPMKKPGTP